ncbi:MAG: alkaline phosphatase family protein [Candidatus Tectomicrobia bacterium]
MGRVLLLGLDGATFDLIMPWAQSGKLPHFAHLLRRGPAGRLRSTVPPMSPPAWNSFMTGKNPGKHGIFDFTERQPQSYAMRFVNATWRRTPALWQYLSDAGKRVAILSVPFTYPPEKVNGIMVSGMDAPGVAGLVNRRATFPPELCDEIQAQVGPYPMGPNLFAYTEPGDMLEAAVRTIEQKAKAALYLYQREAWDCFVFVLGETDAASHRLWRFCDPDSPLRDTQAPDAKMADALLTIYQKADEVIGQFLALATPDTTIIVMSDHGNGGNSDTAVYLNQWLETQEWLRSKTFNRFTKTGIEYAKQLGLRVLPPHVKRAIYRLTNIPNRMESWVRFSALDWKRTLAYSEETPYCPSIWVNLKGREPLGIVEPEAYEKVREQIIAQLVAWRNPYTREPMVKRVWRREELYAGSCVTQAPDLIIEWALDDGYSYLFRPSTGKRQEPVCKIGPQEVRRVKSGDHREEGIFLASGPNLGMPMEVKDAAIVDIAPTLLYVSGLPIPTDMDGKVLTEIFDERYRARHPVQYGPAETSDTTVAPQQDYSEEEEAALRARLRGLGYIE